MFIRFVVGEIDQDSEVAAGVFQALYNLRESGSLIEAEIEQLITLTDWFNQNLAKPTRFNRTKSKGFYRRKAKGISWFKSSSLSHLEKIRELVAILKEHGIHVDTLTTDRPGYIIYEDENQVVAEPFSDTNTG